MPELAKRFPHVKADVAASLVVFLVALPLCLGIAMASGASPMAGLLSGIIGGLVVASLGGSPLQVSGPGNGLIVLVLLVMQQQGAAVLGAVVLAAGALQLLASLARLGQVFRAIPPAIIHGLMAGFACIIFASQFHVVLDRASPGKALDNLFAIPKALGEVLTGGGGSLAAAGLGLLTIAILLNFRSMAPGRLARVPPSLAAVAATTAVATLLAMPVARVSLPENPLAEIQLLDLSVLARLLEWPILQLALVMGTLASIETLLSASAVDRMHDGPRTNYDRELAAQGLGNMLCGIVGAIPVTGVIIRSAANVAAGGKTRLSSVLHGFWLLVLVALLPGLLTLVPTSCLAAILLVAVFKLVNVPALQALWRHDKRELMIALATAATTVILGVLPGVLLGMGLAIAKLLYTIGRLEIVREDDPEQGRTILRLRGTATFLGLPKLATALESVPAGTELHVRFEELNLIDHACLELLINWEKQHEGSGGSLVIDWQRLQGKFTQQNQIQKLPDRPVPAFAAGRPRGRLKFLRSGWQKVLGVAD